MLSSYEFLPAPLWLITALHVVTLTLHFAAMNVLLGGLVVVLLGRFEDRWNHPTVRRMLRLFPSAMAAAITFGVAPLLFLQLVYHRQAYAAAIVSAWFWLGILAAALVGYYILYAAAAGDGAGGARRRVLLWVALVGFLYISFTYSSVFSLAERPDRIRELYAADASGLTLNPDLGRYLARWLHMVLGAVTVGAFFVGVVGRRDPPSLRVARGFFLWGMGATALVGLLYLGSLGDLVGPLMRGPGAWWLTASIALSAGSLHLFFKQRFLPAGGLLGVSLLGMVALRHIVRDLQLAGQFDPASLPVRPQWSVFALFLVCFALAAAVLVYMVRLFVRGRAAPTST